MTAAVRFDWNEKTYSDQHEEAERAEALRARDWIERERERTIREARRAAGQCELCGRGLNAVHRLFRKSRHLSCRTQGPL